LRSLKHYWQQALASLRKSSRPHPQHAPRPEEFERKITAISSENQALSAEFGRVRTDFEQARYEENRKFAALEQDHDELEAAHLQDRNKLAELEQLSSEFSKARIAEAQRLAELERRTEELEIERDRAREEARKLEANLAVTTSRLETADNQIRGLQVLAVDQAKTFEASLSQAATRIDNTEDYVRSVSEKLENEHRLYANMLQEIQLDQRRQDQRVSWTIIVAGFALLLGTVAGAILIWDVQKNARILADMSSDMKSLMSSINGHLSLRHELPKQQPPAPAPASEMLAQPEAASPSISKTLPNIPLQQPAAEPATSSQPAVNVLLPDSAIESIRQAKRQGTRRHTRQEADAYFEENADKSGIVELPSGLQYRVIKAGSGKTPTMADKVVVDYLGATPDGKIFDNTYFADNPATYRMSEVIPGWQEALLQMQEGAEWELYVPPQQAQKGNVRKRGVTGFEPSVYLIELLEVIEGDQ
jgi:FKBP-type peptidyl-prolyl cis-trans isomerase